MIAITTSSSTNVKAKRVAPTGVVTTDELLRDRERVVAGIDTGLSVSRDDFLGKAMKMKSSL